ncbi:MAG: hypothetical protein LQ340_006470 [Diploschistes diacapsis]|nr:MAG: hypothetical protein LQ340_006470 [Diploschistes diacapsis]
MSAPKVSSENGTNAAATVPKLEGNPAFRMLGLPRLRKRLPSRNWLIFFTITGSFTAAVLYDRRERKKSQQKWCNAVSQLSQELLPVNKLQRKVTIYLSAPPGDGLRTSRDHFHEYVKPILVAAALDWDVVEGRKEGDVRAKLAERIRKKRRKTEGSFSTEDEDAVEETRQRLGIHEENMGGGDLVLGRHTWKEYVRGLHEGWLGPLIPPLEPMPQAATDSQQILSVADSSTDNTQPSTPETPDDQSPQADPPEPKAEEPKPKPSPTPPYILPSAYPSATAAPSLPSTLPLTTTLPLPHLLGVFNTPIRISRFLNRRKLADDTGRALATFILASTTSPYIHDVDNDIWEQQALLEPEEQDWSKVARAPDKEGEEGKERPWREDMVIDERVGGRMQKPGETVQEPPEDGDGNSREWKGGVERPERVGWGTWLMRALDLETVEPKCKGWEDGLKGEE